MRLIDALEIIPTAIAFFAQGELIIRGRCSNVHPYDVSVTGLDEALQALVPYVVNPVKTCNVVLGDPDKNGEYTVEFSDDRKPTAQDKAYIAKLVWLARGFGLPVREADV